MSKAIGQSTEADIIATFASDVYVRLLARCDETFATGRADCSDDAEIVVGATFGS